MDFQVTLQFQVSGDITPTEAANAVANHIGSVKYTQEVKTDQKVYRTGEAEAFASVEQVSQHVTPGSYSNF